MLVALPFLLPAGVPWMVKPPVGARINYSNPLGRKLDMLLLFNELGGNTVKDMVSGYTASFQSNAPSWKDGELNFTSSSSQYALFSAGAETAAANAGSVFSYVFWVRTTGAGNMTVLGGSGSGSRQFQLGGGYRFTYVRSVTASILSSTVDTVLGTWNQYALTSDASNNIKMYVNGQLTGSTTNSFSSSNLLTLGSDVGAGQYLNGQIRLLARWQRVLTPDEINQMYMRPYGLLEPRTTIAERSVRSISGQVITMTPILARRGSSGHPEGDE
jgi:hypothetical protein